MLRLILNWVHFLGTFIHENWSEAENDEMISLWHIIPFTYIVWNLWIVRNIPNESTKLSGRCWSKDRRYEFEINFQSKSSLISTSYSRDDSLKHYSNSTDSDDAIEKRAFV